MYNDIAVEEFIARLDAILSFDAQLNLWSGIVAGTLTFMLLERYFHAAPPFRGLTTNIRVAPLLIMVSPLAAIAPAMLVSSMLSVRDGPFYPIPVDFNQLANWLDRFSDTDGRPGPACTAIAVIGYLLLSDFFYYWFHRLQHTRFLWAQHRLHHSDAHLNVLSTHRHHWLEEPLRVLLMILPMSLVFEISNVQSAVMTFFITQWVYFLHANLRIGFGPLTPVIAGPQYHRIHHSIETVHLNKNFATYFPVWDILFGTYYRPGRNEYPATGVRDTASDAGWREILWPFKLPRRKLSGTNSGIDKTAS